MNKEAILMHLREAKDELDRTIRELETDPAYEYADLLVGMGHLYHHLNTAWNGRDASPEQHRQGAATDFHAWRRFPDDSELLLG